jgi:hypothetical protein
VVSVVRAPLPEHPSDLPSHAERVRSPPALGAEVYTTGGTHYWFHDDGERIQVREGDEIAIPATDDSSRARLRSLIRGPGFGTICVQRGWLALHASAVVVDGAAVAFCGPSGRGKSTVAAACYAHGHEAVADDLTPVDPRASAATVNPGVPALEVDGATAEGLGLDADGGTEQGTKAVVDVSDRFATAPSQLERVYLIEDGDEFAVETLGAPEQTFALLDASLALYPESDHAAAETHLSVCGRVGGATTVKRLVRPRSTGRLSELVGVVRADLDTN